MNQKEYVSIAIIIGVVVIVGIAGYFFILGQRTVSSPILIPTPMPSTSTSTIPPQAPTTNTITVLLGQEFTLKRGEIAQLKGLNVFLKVTDFIYSPCPEGAQCVWSGLKVVLELTVDGKVYDASGGALPPEVPYDVLIKETDYKTFATFVINKPSN